MAGKIVNYFAGGNTARGFHSLYDSNLQGLERIYILKGGPGTGKSSLMKKIGNEWLEKGMISSSYIARRITIPLME